MTVSNSGENNRERGTWRTSEDMDNGTTLRMVGYTFRKRQFEILECTMRKRGIGEHMKSEVTLSNVWRTNRKRQFELLEDIMKKRRPEEHINIWKL